MSASQHAYMVRAGHTQIDFFRFTRAGGIVVAVLLFMAFCCTIAGCILDGFYFKFNGLIDLIMSHTKQVGRIGVKMRRCPNS